MALEKSHSLIVDRWNLFEWIYALLFLGMVFVLHYVHVFELVGNAVKQDQRVDRPGGLGQVVYEQFESHQKCF